MRQPPFCNWDWEHRRGLADGNCCAWQCPKAKIALERGDFQLKELNRFPKNSMLKTLCYKTKIRNENPKNRRSTKREHLMNGDIRVFSFGLMCLPEYLINQNYRVPLGRKSLQSSVAALREGASGDALLSYNVPTGLFPSSLHRCSRPWS